MSLFSTDHRSPDKDAPVERILKAVRVLERIAVDPRTGMIICKNPADAAAVFQALCFPKEPCADSIERAYRANRVLIWPTSVTRAGLTNVDSSGLLAKLRAVYLSVHDPDTRKELVTLALQCKHSDIDFAALRLPPVDRLSQKLAKTRLAESPPEPSKATSASPTPTKPNLLVAVARWLFAPSVLIFTYASGGEAPCQLPRIASTVSLSGATGASLCPLKAESGLGPRETLRRFSEQPAGLRTIDWLPYIQRGV